MKLLKLQMGGQMAPEAMPADQMQQGMPQEGGEDVMGQIIELFAQGLQAQDCNALAQGAEMFLQLVQEAQGGAEAAPAGQPVFAKGGKIVSRKQSALQLVRK